MSTPNLHLPKRLHIMKDSDGLRFVYRQAPWKGLMWLGFGVFITFAGWASMAEGLGDCMLLFMFAFGLGMSYIGLVLLINRATFYVTHSELLFYYDPLPYWLPSRQLHTKDLVQLLVQTRKVDAGHGKYNVYVLRGMLRDGRQIDLASEFPADVLYFIEIQIEDWLGITNDPELSTTYGESKTLPEKKKPTREAGLTVPNRLSMVKDNNGLFFSYRSPLWAGFLMIGIGIFFVLLGVGFLLAGGIPTSLPHVIESLMGILSLGGGLVLIYQGLVALINRTTIRVTRNEIYFYDGPLPPVHRKRLQPSDLMQLFVEAKVADAGQDKITYYVLRGVLRDGRKIDLAREMPSDVLQFVELQIEDWLGIGDKKEPGEVGV